VTLYPEFSLFCSNVTYWLVYCIIFKKDFIQYLKFCQPALHTFVSIAVLTNKRVLMNHSTFQQKSPPPHDCLTSPELPLVGVSSLLEALVVSTNDPVVPFKTKGK
jgi:hypothetical protein